MLSTVLQQPSDFFQCLKKMNELASCAKYKHSPNTANTDLITQHTFIHAIFEPIIPSLISGVIFVIKVSPSIVNAFIHANYEG